MANGSLWDINQSASTWLYVACLWLLIYMGSDLEKIEENTGLYWSWGGVLLQFVMTCTAAMYVGVKTTNTIMSRTGGSSFFYQYRGGSVIGDYIKLYGVVAAAMFYAWSVIAALAGFWEGDALIVATRKAAKAGKIEALDGFKTLLSGFIIGLGAWVSGVILGNAAETQLTWFTTYNTKTEGVNSSGTIDSDGTSFTFDLIYTVISIVATVIVGGLPHAAANYMGIEILALEVPL